MTGASCFESSYTFTCKRTQLSECWHNIKMIADILSMIINFLMYHFWQLNNYISYGNQQELKINFYLKWFEYIGDRQV